MIVIAVIGNLNVLQISLSHFNEEKKIYVITAKQYLQKNKYFYNG